MFKVMLKVLCLIVSVTYCYSATVKLCDDINYGGVCVDVTFNSSCVKVPQSLDVKATSLKISGCVKLWTAEDCSGHTVTVNGDQSYLSNFNDITRSLSSCEFTGKTYSAEPQQTWQEHWFDHKQVLNRVFYDEEVAVYFDSDVNKDIQWPFKYLHDVWVYTKKVYGDFGDDKRLYSIFHSGKYSGGHPSTVFDASHDFRSVIDCGSSSKDAWTSGKGNDLDIVTHEVSHIVEGSSKGVHNSPAFDVWKDSKWAEIFIYDVYRGLNRTDDVTRWYNLVNSGHDDFPRANTFWFRDWFYPVYSKYGNTKVLNNFYELLAKYFPKGNSASFSRPQYTRSMNLGEFVHFWSGAANTNLKSLATTAFGWTDSTDKQFTQATKDFAQIKY